MKILFAGCSVTYGDELEDLSDRFSDVIGRELNAEVVNIAGKGLSNDAIVRKIITYFEEGNVADLVIPCFTERSRTESFVNGMLLRFQSNRKYAQDYYKYFYTDEVGQYNYDKNQYFLEVFLRSIGVPFRLLSLRKGTPTEAKGYGYDQYKKTDPYFITFSKDQKLPKGHPNTEAHRILAMEIIDELNRNQLL